jgi:large conductance mechanosensitive channel
MTRSNGSFWTDFRAFLMRGNVLDLAVAVIIGTAFGKVISSLVEDVITPALNHSSKRSSAYHRPQNHALV